MKMCLCFLFKQKTAYEMRMSDWSSDVCSSDLLVDIGVVDAIDVERAQRVVVGDFLRLIVLVAQALEEIHVDDGRAGGDNAVHHVVAHQFRIEVHAAACRGGACDHQKDRKSTRLNSSH